MTAWDIEPQGVQGQLQLTGTRAGSLEKVLTAMIGDLSAAAQAAGTAVPGSAVHPTQVGPVAPGPRPSPLMAPQKAMGPVAAALSQYAEKRSPALKAMADRIQAAVLGAAKATGEYVEGDLASAKEAQDAARQVRLDLLMRDTGGNQR
ncbi:DUF6507 family protein [Streptomyces xantholiticus]|uniref:DUF6507 family protein n=1 Tax=Streptomyces xantholiticus TaxID=68285 RepID=A0ABV1UWN6_9ACTN